MIAEIINICIFKGICLFRKQHIGYDDTSVVSHQMAAEGKRHSKFNQGQAFFVRADKTPGPSLGFWVISSAFLLYIMCVHKERDVHWLTHLLHKMKVSCVSLFILNKLSRAIMIINKIHYSKEQHCCCIICNVYTY